MNTHLIISFFLKYWSPIVATLAFLLSVYSGVNTWITKHAKPLFHINWIHKISSQYNISLEIYNPSSKPISLRKANITINRKIKFKAISYPLILSSQEPEHHLKDKKSYQLATFTDPAKVCWSTGFPVNINPFTSRNIILPFQSVDIDLEKLKPGQCELILKYNKRSKKTIELSVKELLINEQEYTRRTYALMS
ncbi:hypothetical protein [uncultured Limosilactobacillus sp.]|uniref:hypothetical protein n=1 Tax=uncultured Limosilactobacillus sp. TaxID=2837629 RepID=UPI0025D6BAB9|nr:hypothetical protein [uncultured Limosilactobacillus sp.]